MLICFAAWLGGCCVFDDILDTLSPHDAEVALLESILIMQYRQGQDPTGESFLASSSSMN